MLFSFFIWTSLQFIGQESYLDLPDFDHWKAWKTIETKHFNLHFEEKNLSIASRLAPMMEPQFEEISKRFQWRPSGTTHVVISDNSDESNGLSTPLPYNTIYLYVAPPTDDSSLDYIDNWLKTLFTHELTHTIHIDQVGGINKMLRAIFGRIIVPNAIQQQWGLEGLAVLLETLESTKGRGRSPYVEMVLRTAALEDQFLSIDRATYWHDRYPYGNAAYFYGIGFYQWLIKNYGEDKVFEWTRTTARWILPSFFNFKAKKIFKKGLSRLWIEWENSLKKEVSSLSSQWKKQALSVQKGNERLEGLPVWSEDGKTLYAPVTDEKFRRKIVAYQEVDGQWQVQDTLGWGIAPGRISLASGKLYYSKSSYVDRYKSSNDIYELDLKSREQKRLTRGMRARDPMATKSWIYAVVTQKIRSRIIRFKAETPSQIETLYEANGFNTLSKPALSKDENQIVFSERDERGRFLVLLHLPSKKTKILTSPEMEAYSPSFINDETIQFTRLDSRRIQNIYSMNISSFVSHRLTDFVTGTQWPVASKNHLAYGQYQSSGLKLTIEKTPLSFKETETLNPSKLQEIAKQDQKNEEFAAGLPVKPYSSTSAILPHFLLPFFFYTESDTAVGIQTGSADPLHRWTWGGVAYYLASPQRPGGGLSVSYQGFNPVRLFASGYASITDYGVILVENNGGVLTVLPNHYYERNYAGNLGYAHTFHTSDGPSPFSILQTFYYEKRNNLLDLPLNTASGKSETLTISRGGVSTTYPNVALGPEEGYEWGSNVAFEFRKWFRPSASQISPHLGTSIRLSVDYAPNYPKDAIEHLVTVVSGKQYFEVWDGHFLALESAVGMQWLDSVYQRTFRLGGSFAESPLYSISNRIYALRGLESSLLRGEGIVQSSLEYRVGLLKSLPGFGTAPVWLKNLSLSLFGDLGQTFRRKNEYNLAEVLSQTMPPRFSWTNWTTSTGLELRCPVSISYAPPLLFRFGYGHVLLLEGDWVGNKKRSEFYLAAGSSF